MKPLENLKEYFQKYEETHTREDQASKLPYSVAFDLINSLDNNDFWVDGMKIILDVDNIYPDMSLFIDLEEVEAFTNDFYIIDDESSREEGAPVYVLREDWREEMDNNLRKYVGRYIYKTKIELA